MANGWLLVSDFDCRLWGRTGFLSIRRRIRIRDQLQDVMALVHAEPPSLASICSAPPRINSAKAMCSIGGIHRWARCADALFR